MEGRYRLGVRTGGSQPSNRGSIPRSATSHYRGPRLRRGPFSSRRGDSPLRPNPRRVRVEDDRGHSYFPMGEGLRALESEGKAGIPLDHPLRPGESYSTSLVFDLPREVRSSRLLIAEDLLVTRLLIGHENSFLHKKLWFRLSPPVSE